LILLVFASPHPPPLVPLRVSFTFGSAAHASVSSQLVLASSARSDDAPDGSARVPVVSSELMTTHYLQSASGDPCSCFSAGPFRGIISGCVFPSLSPVEARCICCLVLSFSPTHDLFPLRIPHRGQRACSGDSTPFAPCVFPCVPMEVKVSVCLHDQIWTCSSFSHLYVQYFQGKVRSQRTVKPNCCSPSNGLKSRAPIYDRAVFPCSDPERRYFSLLDHECLFVSRPVPVFTRSQFYGADQLT